MEPPADLLLLRQLADAAAAGDAPRVAALLLRGDGSAAAAAAAAAPALDGALLPATAAQRELLVLLRGDATTTTAAAAAAAAAVLEGVPAAHELPWRAACGLLAPSSRRRLDRPALAAVQRFLQAAAAAWCRGERHRRRSHGAAAPAAPKRMRPSGASAGADGGAGEEDHPRTPREFLLELVEQSMRRLAVAPEAGGTDDDGTDGGDDDDAALACELMAYLVTLARDLDDPPLLRDCLDRAVATPAPGDLRAAAVAPWLQMVADLRPVLRPRDWRRVQLLVRVRSRDIPVSALPDYARAAVTLATSLASAAASTSAAPAPSSGLVVEWQQILAGVLWPSRADLAATSAVEQALQDQLTLLDAPTLSQWTGILVVSFTSDDDDDDGNGSADPRDGLSRSLHCNLLLVVLRALRRSGSELLARMLSQALGRRGGPPPAAATTLCWNGLSSGALGRQRRRARRRQGKKQAFTIDAVRSILGGVAYVGRGKFVDQRGGQRRDDLSDVGAMIVSSLHLKRDGRSGGEPAQSMQRSETWLSVAMDAIEDTVPQEDIYDWIVVYVVMVVVYCEQASTRPLMVQRILDNFAGVRGFGRNLDMKSSLFGLVLSTILASGTTETLPSNDALRGLDAVFTKQLSLPVFMRMATCLSKLESVRKALLIVVQTRIRPSDELGWLEGVAGRSRGLQEQLDHLHCGLFALVTLVASANWNECEFMAWTIMINLIVECKPDIPISSRSWLFELLSIRCKEGCFSSITSGHILAPVLLRLLDTLGETDESKEYFDFMKAISFYEDGRANVKEDIPSLLRLALSLCHSIASNDVDEAALILAWRHQLQALTGVQRHVHENHRFCLQDKQFSLIHGTFFFCLRVYETVNLISCTSFSNQSLIALKSRVRSQCLHTLACHESPVAPCGLEGRVPNNKDRRHVDEEDSMAIKTLKDELRHILSEFFIGDRWNELSTSVAQMDDPYDDEPITIVLAFCALSSQINLDQSSSSVGYTVTTQSVFMSFAKLTVPIVKAFVSVEDSHEDMDKLLNVMMNLCSAVVDAKPTEGMDLTSSSGSDESSIHQELAHTAWYIYSSLCDENAAAQLRLYFDKILDRRSESEINLFLRSFRYKVVLVLAKCIQQAFGSMLDPDTWIIKSVRNSSSDGDSSISFLSSIIEKSAGDLLQGMGGESGQVDFDLFGAYVECLQVCIHELLRRCPLCTRSAHLQHVVTVSLQASKNLERIVCSYAIRNVPVFKMCLALSLYNLPSVARATILHLCLDGISGPFDHFATLGTLAFCESALTQCISIISRRRLDMIWDKVVGEEHTSSITWDAHSQNSTSTHKFLQFVSERHWSTAFCVALEGLAFLWEESLHCFQDNVTKVFPSLLSAECYMQIRQRDLSTTWKCLTTLRAELHSVGPDADTPEAMDLPSQVRKRIFTLFDRIVTVQIKVLRNMMRCIQRGQGTKGFLNLSTAESVACISVWLCADSSTDIIADAREWYLLEKQSKQIAESAHLRAEYLESSLHRLERVLVTKGDGSPDFVVDCNHWLRRCVVSSAEEDDPENSMLLSLVRTKLKETAVRLSNMSGSEKAKKMSREKEIARRARKERNKKVFRSRNKAVDDFYQDDMNQRLSYIQRSGMDDAMDDDDAYDDLEDFLVE